MACTVKKPPAQLQPRRQRTLSFLVSVGCSSRWTPGTVKEELLRKTGLEEAMLCHTQSSELSLATHSRRAH